MQVVSLYELLNVLTSFRPALIRVMHMLTAISFVVLMNAMNSSLE